MDEAEPRRADHAYIARRKLGNHTVVHIAGLHALGSIGASHYITRTLPELFAEYGDAESSMAVTTEYDGMSPTSIKVLIPPRKW